MTISRVQTGTGTHVGDIQVTVTMGAAPTEGNLLVAFVFTRASALTPPTGWTRVVSCNPSFSFTNDAAIFVKLAGASEGTTYVWTHASNQSTGIIREYSSTTGWPSNINDVIGVSASTNGTAASTSKSSGTTATTAEADALLVAGFGVREQVSAQSFTNTFGNLTDIYTSGTPPAYAHSHLADRIVTATAAYETTMSWTTSAEAGGVIAALYPNADTVSTSGTINAGGGISASVTKRLNQTVRPTSTVSAGTWDTGPTAGQSLHGYTSDASDTTYIYDPVA